MSAAPERNHRFETRLSGASLSLIGLPPPWLAAAGKDRITKEQVSLRWLLSDQRLGMYRFAGSLEEGC